MTNITRAVSVSSKSIATLHSTAIRSSSIPMMHHERIPPVSKQNPRSIRKFSSQVTNDNVSNHDLAKLLLLLSTPSSQTTNPSPTWDSSETDKVPSHPRRFEDGNSNQGEGHHRRDDNYKLKLKKKAAISRYFS
mmetsp:Transcript_26027/g.61122  ORF Transcript_26027/g.61122 Transcript_26027/m.61122 type:complete len:134 (+) Transcript_26027:88-489(+)